MFRARICEMVSVTNTCTSMQVLVTSYMSLVLPHSIRSLEEPECSSEVHKHPPPLSSVADERSLDRAARLFRALGDIARLRLAGRLAGGECCVTELANAEGESISTISQRLRVLRAENIVVRRRRGKHVNYALADEHVADMIKNAVVHASEPVLPGSTGWS